MPLASYKIILFGKDGEALRTVVSGDATSAFSAAEHEPLCHSASLHLEEQAVCLLQRIVEGGDSAWQINPAPVVPG